MRKMVNGQMSMVIGHFFRVHHKTLTTMQMLLAKGILMLYLLVFYIFLLSNGIAEKLQVHINLQNLKN